MLGEHAKSHCEINEGDKHMLMSEMLLLLLNSCAAVVGAQYNVCLKQ